MATNQLSVYFQSVQEPIKWDEMNIMQTLHPVDKDYGLMKIEEPKTPYSYYEDSNENSSFEQGESSKLDLERLVQNMDQHRPAKVLTEQSEDDDGDDEDYETLSEEEKMKRKEFEIKRKMHYNEFQAVKLARKLLEEDDEEEEDNNKSEGNQFEPMEPKTDDETSKDCELST